MAEGKVNTIIIKDRTSGSGQNYVKTSDVKSDGTVEKKKTRRKVKDNAVEPNRLQRVYNSSLNKLTGGMWEKGNRFYRAATGAFKGNMVGTAIIAQFVVNEVYAQLQNYVKEADEKNQNDILRYRVGDKQLGMNYTGTTHWFSGKIKLKNNR